MRVNRVALSASRRGRKYGWGWPLSRWNSKKKMVVPGMAGIAVALFVAGCDGPQETAPAMDITPLSYQALTGWAADDLDDALATFQASCRSIVGRDPGARLDVKIAPESIYGRVGDWLPACHAALADAATKRPGSTSDSDFARQFFEAHFTPVLLTASGEETGLFTGYYEPEIKASRTRQGAYQTPLLSAPADLVTVDLSLFNPAPKRVTDKLRGRVEAGRLLPYPTRREIERDIEHQGPETQGPALTQVLAWVADPVDAFFMHIQGSGRLLYADGTWQRLAFAQKNGRPYTPIGRALIERGALTAENVSMASIREWLASHPDQAPEILHLNDSYIFFKAVEGPAPLETGETGETGEAGGVEDNAGPPGAAGINLTPKRSLAVDRHYHPLGALLWLDASAPSGPLGPDGPAGGAGSDQPFRHLMVAQDTGSAILGPIRGDVFWGSGPAAGAIAGAMKHQGRLIALLPNDRISAIQKGK